MNVDDLVRGVGIDDLGAFHGDMRVCRKREVAHHDRGEAREFAHLVHRLVLGDMAGALSLVMGAVAFGVFAVLAVASLLRWQRHTAALEEDLKHPVRHAFVAAVPVSMRPTPTAASWPT